MDKDFTESLKFVFLQSTPTAFLILLPLSMKRDMSAFKYGSIGSIVCLTYTAIVLLIEMPGYLNDNLDTAHYQPIFLDLNLLTGASMTFYAF
jgi:uncharacterized membrane protein